MNMNQHCNNTNSESKDVPSSLGKKDIYYKGGGKGGAGKGKGKGGAGKGKAGGKGQFPNLLAYIKAQAKADMAYGFLSVGEPRATPQYVTAS